MKTIVDARIAMAVLIAAVLACSVAVPAFAKADPLKETSSTTVLKPMDVMRVLAGSRDKVTVLVFWATWCQPCRAEVPELVALRKAFTEDELTLVGLSVDEDVSAYNEFVAKTGFNYPVRRVTDSVSQMFNVGAIPRLVVYGPGGKLAINHEGMAGSEDLKKAVRELLEGKK